VAASQLLLNCEINEAMFFFCPRLAKIKRHVDEHFDEPFTLTQAAEIAALEKTYFSKIFKDKVGISFVDWLGRERIKRAVLMLMEHDHRITDLAFAVGFADLRTFERAFKKCVGITPRQCKNIVRQHSQTGSTAGELRWIEIAPTLHDASL
jgi:two-component system response regulator YesN